MFCPGSRQAWDTALNMIDTGSANLELKSFKDGEMS